MNYKIDKEVILRWSLIAAIAFLLMLLVHQCDPPIVQETIGTQVETRTVIDTVEFRDTIIIREPHYITKIKTIYSEDSSKVVSIYESKIEDSLISGLITTNISDKGDLLYQRLTYTPKFPKYINRIDSVFTTTTITRTEIPSPKTHLLIGVQGIVGKEAIGFGPSAQLYIKERLNINVGYDLFNKAATFGVAIPLKIKTK